jgi:hypothetical protein
MEIWFEADTIKGSWNVLSPSILRSFRLKPSDVANVSLAYYALSNYPYEEVNVARCSHPCEGSIGFYIETYDGHKYLTEEIFFYDYNETQNPYNSNGLPHWNRERRLNDGNRTWYQKAKYVEYHAIPESPSITWKVIDKGETINEKVIYSVPLDQVRKRK